MLSTADLAALRAEFNQSLPDTAQVQRVTRQSDGAGGSTETWTTIATVACRVSPMGNLPVERAIADRLTGVQFWAVTLPAATDITAADRIVSGGRTFEVVGVLAPRTWELARRVVCTEAL